MADLTVRSDDRGQLILIAAIGLAILLTLMTLALNTAVFGEIHAAQTDDSLKEERGVVQYQHSVERGIGGLIAPLNREHDEYETLESELDDAVVAWNNLSRAERLRDGTTSNVSLENVTYETRIVQNESGPFVDRAGNTEWTVAENVSDVRGFETYVTQEELAETSDCTDGEACFTVEVEGADGGSWQLFVYNDSGVMITVEPASGDDETYGPLGSSVRLNLTDVIEAGDFSEEDVEIEAPYTLRFTNADNVSGTYELTVGKKIVDGTIADDERYGVDDAPRIDARIDSAVVRVRYRSPALSYETETGVVPGETDG